MKIIEENNYLNIQMDKNTKYNSKKQKYEKEIG